MHQLSNTDARSDSSAHTLPRLQRQTMALIIALATLLGPTWAHAAPARVAQTPAAGVVGTGTPASCTEDALYGALSGGGVITFNCGGPAVITITRTIDIATSVSIDGGHSISLTGGLSTPIFGVTSNGALTVSNLTLMQALNLFGDGGAIINAGRLYANAVTFTLNSINPTYSGAAIFTTGPAEIENSQFIGNDAGSAGAIFANTTGARVRISESSFANNRTVNASFGYGGAIWVGNGAHVTLQNAGFVNNRANLGGAVFVTSGGILEMLNTSFLRLVAQNYALGSGGAIYNEGSALVSGVSFRENTTPTDGGLGNYGGAIASVGVLTITQSFFRDNASRYGGAVFTGGSSGAGSGRIEHTAFSRNRAVVLGGGLYTNVKTNSVVIDDVSFNANTAQSGGGIARINADLVVRNTSLTNNAAGNGGGGIFVGKVPVTETVSYVELQNVTISGNLSENSQGGGVLNTAPMTLYHTTIVSNTQGVQTLGFSNMRFRSSVLYNPGAANCMGEAGSSFSNDGANFVSDTSCGLGDFGNGQDPMLAQLTSDGFQNTRYHLPLAGSPLLNLGVSCPERDQRGALRPDACDIGAVEQRGMLPVVRLPLVMQ